MKPVPWEIDAANTEDDARSATKMAKDVGTTGRVSQQVLDFMNDSYPVGRVFEWAPGEDYQFGAKDARHVF